MDTPEDLKYELQTLRKEINALRQENLMLHKKLVNQNETLNSMILSFNTQILSAFKSLAEQSVNLGKMIQLSYSQHLEIHLMRLAGAQTAEFIAANMNKVKSFNDKKTYLQYVLNHIENITGGGGIWYLEFGVFNGETINIISETVTDKIIYGFDSFEGLPETWHYGFLKEAFSLNGNLPKVNENVRLIKGWFNETLPDFVKEHPEPCAFIHIDCDLYSSTKTVFDTLKNQIVSGTVIAFDDYFNYPNWQEDGEYKAFMEFVAENNLEFEYIARTNHQQVAVKIK